MRCRTEVCTGCPFETAKDTPCNPATAFCLKAPWYKKAWSKVKKALRYLSLPLAVVSLSIGFILHAISLLIQAIAFLFLLQPYTALETILEIKDDIKTSVRDL